MGSLIYLTRHGSTFRNEQSLGLLDTLPPDEDPDDLSMHGVAQADILGRYLAQTVKGDFEFLASTTSRSIDSAVIMAESLGITLDPSFAWKHPQFWIRDDLKESLIVEYHKEDYSSVQHLMKTEQEAYTLVLRALLSRTHTPKNLIAVLHLNLIRAFLANLETPFPITREHAYDHCGVYLLQRLEDRIEFLAYRSNNELRERLKTST